MRRIMKLLSETLLTLAALGGAACIVLVVLAFTGGYSLIMFKTGSMHPTIPAGSVALVQEIPAADVEIGDILTVDRDNALPVTHRVTSIEAGPTADARTITMRGDANDAEDPLPYDITSARVTIGSVPHLAHVIAWFGNPWIMAGITLGAASLVTWAFWPRNIPVNVHEDDEPRKRTAGKHAMLVGVLLVTATSTIWPANGAQADSGKYLTVTSNLEPGKKYELHPTVALNWDLTIDAHAVPNFGTLDLSIANTTDSTLKVQAEIAVCDGTWVNGACSGPMTPLQSPYSIPANGNWTHLHSAAVPGEVGLRLALTAPAVESFMTAQSSQLVVRASAEEFVEEIHLDGGAALSTTGRSLSGVGLILAPTAIMSGLVVAYLGYVRRRRRQLEMGDHER